MTLKTSSVHLRLCGSVDSCLSFKPGSCGSSPTFAEFIHHLTQSSGSNLLKRSSSLQSQWLRRESVVFQSQRPEFKSHYCRLSIILIRQGVPKTSYCCEIHDGRVDKHTLSEDKTVMKTRAQISLLRWKMLQFY